MESPVHSKIYLMKSKDGHTGVALGSANLTENALTNRGKTQYEELAVYDDSPLYDIYMGRFAAIESGCFDYVPASVRENVPASVRERWHDGKTLVDTDDADAMAAILVEMATTPGAKKLFAATGAEFAEQESRLKTKDPNLSKRDAELVELVHKTKVNGKGEHQI